jgi:3-isopropylmalate/(R)-2-methylmalate dehydratase small subunit
MAQFTILTSRFIPLPAESVDTDQIIPARYLKGTDKDGLGTALFSDWRYQADGSPRPDFVLNQPQYREAQILLAGDNFGCGSSREHAPWALTGFGIRAVISTSFADIFSNNALKNGLLPVLVDAPTHHRLFELSATDPLAELTVNLPNQALLYPGGQITFPIDSFSKTCLLNGIDELGYIFEFSAEIAAYESQRGIMAIQVFEKWN